MHRAKEIHKPIIWTELAGDSTQKEAAEAKKITEFLELNPFEYQVMLLLIPFFALYRMYCVASLFVLTVEY
jgi:hypothetical protein